MQGPQALVAVSINGREARLLADSGTLYSTLSAAGAARLGLSVSAPPEPIMTQGVGGDEPASMTTARSFTLGKASLADVQFIVGGISPPGAVGVLGENVLGRFDTEYDFAHGLIRLVRPRDCAHADLAYWATARPHSMMAIERGAGSIDVPRGTAWLNGTAIRVLFDTGATHSLLALRAAERAGVRPDSPGVTPGGELHGAGPHPIRSWIAPFASFRIGDEEILHTHLRVGDLGLGDTDMLLGADFFLAHHVYISASQQRAYFTYNGGPVFNLSAPPTAPAANH